jgi:2-polyprenyl-6-methoxyphenol hydroxylase-like FAD-dependent oxidoreductase
MGVGSTPLQYNVPGRMASIVADGRDPARAIALCVFSAPPLEYSWNDTDRQKELVTTAFAGMGWRVPQLLAGLAAADELYFDSICRVGMKGWTKGRVALLGDAGFGVTLGGMGVGTGIVAAYVLAGELAVAGGDHRVAFSSYERRMRPLAGRWQRGASPGQFLAPRTAAGLWLRNRLFGSKAVQRAMVAGTTKIATDERLPDYPAVIASRSAAMPGR